MGRAERRRNAKKEKKERKTTYNLTREQLNNMVHERVEDELVRMRQEAMEEAINTAMFLLLTLPLKVLMDHYWKKSYTKRMPEFINYVPQALGLFPQTIHLRYRARTGWRC